MSRTCLHTLCFCQISWKSKLFTIQIRLCCTTNYLTPLEFLCLLYAVYVYLYLYSVRHANIFNVNLNVEAKSKVTFNLTYEELLIRKFNRYEHAININPEKVRAYIM